MDLRCIIGSHAPGADSVWNDGYFVTKCCRCSSDLIRLRYGAWQRVPKKCRITWRPKPDGYPDWNSAARARADLPFSPRYESSAQRQEPFGLRLVSSNSSPVELEAEMPTFRDWRRLKASA